MEVYAPASETEAAAIVADCAAQKRSLAIEGHGSKGGLGRVIETAGLLKLNRLSGVVAYESEELVITVRAGTPLAEVERVLGEKNQCLAFEPSSWSFGGAGATIGGTIAASVAGSRRVVRGGARDHIIGFRAVNGEGEIFKAGGRVVKNVTGYDLPKLAAGSYGTLFAMTELTLRTYPRVETALTLFVRNLDVDSGCALLRRAASLPFEASGFCYLPRSALGRMSVGLHDSAVASLVAIRFEGSPESMATRARACGQGLGVEFETVLAGGGEDLWSQLVQLRPFEAARTVWRLSVPPSDVVAAIAALRADCFVVDWAGGLLWAETGGADAVHEVARAHGGHAMLFRGSDEMRKGQVFQPPDAATLALTRRVKAAFDPASIFNPGRMYEGV